MTPTVFCIVYMIGIQTKDFLHYSLSTGLLVIVVLNQLREFSMLFFEHFIGQFLVILIFILTEVNPRNCMVTFVFQSNLPFGRKNLVFSEFS